MPDDFDVFLSHNTRDKPRVEEIAARLRSEGLRVWLDKWELRPGFPWQEGLEEGVKASRAGAVFVGEGGLGAWQEPEMRAFIARSRRETIPVIPVLLPGCPDSPQLTLFLEAFTWVDLRDGLTEDGLARLVWGITGEKPEGTGMVAVASSRHSAVAPSHAKSRRTWWNWGIGISILGVVLTLAAWFWPRPPASPTPTRKPELYYIRVQVRDPQGQLLRESTVGASTVYVPLQLQDGSWDIQISAAKVPADGKISLWAEHKDWEGNRVDLHLGEEQNPQAEIILKTPETWLRGRVVDGHDQGMPGVRISRDDGGPGEPSITDREGRFTLKLSVPRETGVWLRSEHPGSAPGRNRCYAGRDSCSITLEKR